MSTWWNEKYWNRCEICGCFIGFQEFAEGKAERHLLTPDTDFTIESYETYHVDCSARTQTKLDATPGI